MHDNESDDQLSFRQESIDNVFSQNRKPFHIKSPANLTIYTITFFMFLVFVFASLHFIKLPVHINAVGEVLAGNDYHQIVINEDKQVVNDLSVFEGDEVTEGQVLLQLKHSDKNATESTIADIDLQINDLQAQIHKAAALRQASLLNIARQREDQHKVIEQLKDEQREQEGVLARYQDNVAKGLIAATFQDAQQRVVSQIKSNIVKEQTAFTTFDLMQLEVNNKFKQLTQANNANVARLNLKKNQLNNGQQILAPCDCKIDNVLVEKGMMVVPGQSILTLSRARNKTTLVMYIQALEYRQIVQGKQIQVNMAAYPSNKYGALNATVVHVSSSPVPGELVSKKGQGLQDSTYFIIKAAVDQVPPNISLVTGMLVESDIVIDQVSLFDLMFDFKTAK